MADWTPEEQLAVDIAFALKKVKIPGFRKALVEEGRFRIAQTIASTSSCADGSFRSLRRPCSKVPSKLATTSLWNDWPL